MTYPGQSTPGGVPSYGPPPGHPEGHQQSYQQGPAAYQQGYPQGYYAVPPPLPVPRAPNGMPLANFGERLLAYLIDAAVFFGVALVVAIPAVFAILAVLGAQIATLETDPETGELVGEPNFALFVGPVLLIEFGVLLAMLAASYLYHVELAPSRRADTLGKRAMKLRVIRLDDPSAPITRGIAARRWAMQSLVGLVVPFFSWVDGLWQLWDKPYQQCLHDKVAETVVVKVST